MKQQLQIICYQGLFREPWFLFLGFFIVHTNIFLYYQYLMTTTLTKSHSVAPASWNSCPFLHCCLYRDTHGLQDNVHSILISAFKPTQVSCSCSPPQCSAKSRDLNNQEFHVLTHNEHLLASIRMVGREIIAEVKRTCTVCQVSGNFGLHSSKTQLRLTPFTLGRYREKCIRLFHFGLAIWNIRYLRKWDNMRKAGLNKEVQFN